VAAAAQELRCNLMEEVRSSMGEALRGDALQGYDEDDANDMASKTLLCASHWLNTYLGWAMGANGTDNTRKNEDATKLFAKVAAMASVFTKSIIANDLRRELYVVQYAAPEVDFIDELEEEELAAQKGIELQ
ncbi:unnamed protein product, partial [Chrysoparadoxa australica]